MIQYLKKTLKCILGEKNYQRIKVVFKHNDSVEENLKVKDHLRGFDVHVVEHCNLGCWGCNHYSPLAEKEFLDINVFERDIKRMSELTNQKIDYLYLLGGEPLLHPNITEFFRIARKYFPYNRIDLFTNGTLLLKQKQYFWGKMREYNISILASKYPVLNWDKIEKRIIENKIKFCYAFGNEKKTWFCPIDITGSQNPKKAFVSCGGANKCTFLYRGRLFTCSMAPNFHHFSKYFGVDIKLQKKDSIDIHKAKNIESILKFLAKPIPACRYCNPWDFEVSPWKRTERNINEWVKSSDDKK